MVSEPSSVRSGRSAFTLVELLVVIGIMSLLMAIGLAVPKGDKRRVAVEAAAKELAGTMRVARSLALERRAGYAVAFNITNSPGSSGKVLNNWSGGHWYQIIGPRDENVGEIRGLATIPEASFLGVLNPVPAFLSRVAKSWVGNRTVLTPRAVRFLSLSDQDNGFIRVWQNHPFPATYPRPWFGWYDTTAQRLYPWGGYDATRSGGVPAINLDGNPCSGFWYEGQDGPIPDSKNPADRTSTELSVVSQFHNTKIFVQGEPRPLVNGDWLDAYIRFQPDGTVAAGPFGRARWDSRNHRTGMPQSGGGNAVSGYGDLGDLTSDPNSSNLPISDEWAWQGNASSHDSRTGYWFVTLAPDAEEDTDQFPSTQAALRSLTPMYRVGVNAFGDIRIVHVVRGLPDGAVLDTSIGASDWQSGGIMERKYQRNVLTNDDGSPRGTAIIDAVTPEMLEQRAMWAAP